MTSIGTLLLQYRILPSTDLTLDSQNTTRASYRPLNGINYSLPHYQPQLSYAEYALQWDYFLQTFFS
jgi:hypothetical protein